MTPEKGSTPRDNSANAPANLDGQAEWTPNVGQNDKASFIGYLDESPPRDRDGKLAIVRYLDESPEDEKPASVRYLDDSPQHETPNFLRYISGEENQPIGTTAVETNTSTVTARQVTRPAPAIRSEAAPGAYAGMPGADMERRASANYSGVQQPGTGRRERGALHQAEQGLVQATQVQNESSLMMAQEVDFGVLQEKEAKQKRRKGCRMAGVAIVAICCLVVAIVVGLMRGRKNERTSTVPSTPAPSMAPTSQAPSFAPSTILEAHAWMEFPNSTLEALKDPLSPQSLSYLWLTKHPNITNMPNWEMTQLFAVVTFYHAMDGDNWPYDLRTSWLQYDRSCCHWLSSEHGFFTSANDFVGREESASCNDEGKMHSLSLDHWDFSNLHSPYIPPEIGLLPSLDFVGFNGGFLQGPLTEFLPPSTLQSLTSIRWLELVSNNFTGPVPSELGLLTKLIHLNLSLNDLDGFLPSELYLLTNLTYLNARSSLLSNTTIPSELGLLTQLTYLDLESTYLSGTIPKEIFQGLTNLKVLVLNENFLGGPLPSELASLTNISVLELRSNFFSGVIPVELAKQTNLAVVMLDDNLLSGTLPSQFGLLSRANVLSFGRNMLSGTVPSDWGLLTSLISLDANGNSLTGQIPTDLGLMQSLHFALDLGQNQLTGSIPSELGQCNKLLVLSLRSNSIGGHVPTELGLVDFALGVDLGNNLLSGPIPTEFAAFQNLLSLLLDSNFLTGTIPPINDHLGVFNISGNRNLTGSLPSELCALQMQNCTCFFPDLCDSCLLDFDCTEQLCGCGCGCAGE